jgi:DNA-binding response OmpR family regulator
VGIHHGTIDVESEKGKGSKFIIGFPLNESIFNPGEIHQYKASDLDYKHDLVEIERDKVLEEKLNNLELEGKDTILIVEDNVDIINYLKENLSERYNISSALNGEEAMKIVNEKQPDLIISDVMMPVMDGIKFCKNVKQNIKTCHIPVIMLTAKSQIDDQVEGIKSGADDYIPKPFSMSLLEAKVKNTIKTRKRLKAYYSNTMEIEPEKLAFTTLDEELLQKAKRIVEENIAEPEFSVDIFAQGMGMSRSNLHLKLKSITGESATDFIKKVRFGKALQLLEQKKYSVAEISYMVGFNSPSYFSTSFKKYFGYLPTEHGEK